MNGALPSDLVAIVAFALNVLLTVTIVALVALAGAHFILRRDASARYLLCLTALVCILLAPLVIGLLGKVHCGLLVFALPATAQPQPLSDMGVGASVGVVASSPQFCSRPFALKLDLLLSIWTLGAAWGAVRFLWGWRTAAQLRRAVRPLDVAAVGSALDQVERTLRATPPPIFASERVVAPVAVGLFRPAVILPASLAEALTPAQLRHVLLHECAHVAFRHALGGIVQRLAGLIYWPHPLVAVLCRELARAREEVCDDVASQEDGAACYARTLLTIAQGISAAPQYASALALLGPGTSLEKRITGLLDPRRNRMVGVRRWKVWTVTGAVTLTMALAAAIRVVADETQAKQEAGLQRTVDEHQRAAQAEKQRAEQAVDEAKRALDREQAAVAGRSQPVTGQAADKAKLEAEQRALELLHARQKTARLEKMTLTDTVGVLELTPGERLPDGSQVMIGVNKQTGTTYRIVVRPDASAPGEAKTAYRSIQIQAPFVFTVAHPARGTEFHITSAAVAADLAHAAKGTKAVAPMASTRRQTSDEATKATFTLNPSDGK